MEEIEYKIWFSKLNLNNRIKLQLIEDFKNAKNLWKATKEELKEKRYSEKVIFNIFDSNKKMNLEKEYLILLDKNIKIVSMYDKEFPIRLLNISDCPTQLYVRGNIKKLYENNVAIIGSRKASEYGKSISRKIAKDLSSLNINTVSGLAVGIDKFAHLGALDIKGGNTIAVLGSGLCEDVFYPFENLKVYQRILSEGGTIITEYPFFERPIAYHFPQRNRLISGLSDKIIVVEASEKSGSLITVEYALEQGKDVYAVPGNINNFHSSGTNKLIQDGAFPFLKISDVII